ncbi:hypothetical protein Q0812_11095 [Brevundimonas sp. 2R-24]|uniref:Uncharacterized protein n=1 Tax=Peiella sedimenti TaxID=3061083 RepID=A0ABT8SNA9_9CAUL|nr:hypothetical protein [Caulobacteraceae bacterium XZ-24]
MRTREHVFSQKERRLYKRAVVGAVMLTLTITLAKAFVLTPPVSVAEWAPIEGVAAAQPLN